MICYLCFNSQIFHFSHVFPYLYYSMKTAIVILYTLLVFTEEKNFFHCRMSTKGYFQVLEREDHKIVL